MSFLVYARMALPSHILAFANIGREPTFLHQEEVLRAIQVASGVGGGIDLML
jgi:hypothetical protein